MTLEGVRAHQQAFQEIADANGGTRASGTAGYDESVAYVAGALEDAGYEVTLQSFDFQTFITLSPTVLEQVSPEPAGPIENTVLSYSGSGDVTALSPARRLSGDATQPTSQASRQAASP